MYCTFVGSVGFGRFGGRFRLIGCLVTLLVRLELFVLDVGGEFLCSGRRNIVLYLEFVILKLNIKLVVLVLFVFWILVRVRLLV